MDNDVCERFGTIYIHTYIPYRLIVSLVPEIKQKNRQSIPERQLLYI